MGKHKHWSLKDTQSCLLHTDMPYLLVCWKYYLSNLTPSSRPPFGFCTLGLSFCIRKWHKIALTCTSFLVLYTYLPPLYHTLPSYSTFCLFATAVNLIPLTVPYTWTSLTSTISLVLQLAHFSQWCSLIQPLEPSLWESPHLYLVGLGKGT